MGATRCRLQTRLAAGVRAGRRGARFLSRQYRRCESGAVEDVTLADLQLFETEVRQDLSSYHCSSQDHRRTLRVEWAHAATLLERHRCKTLKLLFERRCAQLGSVDSIAVVLVQAERERPEARERPRDTDCGAGIALDLVGHTFRQQRAHRGSGAAEL